MDSCKVGQAGDRRVANVRHWGIEKFEAAVLHPFPVGFMQGHAQQSVDDFVRDIAAEGFLRLLFATGEISSYFIIW